MGRLITLDLKRYSVSPKQGRGLTHVTWRPLVLSALYGQSREYPSAVGIEDRSESSDDRLSSASA